MTIKETKSALDLVLKHPQVITPYIHGFPGIGKSAIVNQVAVERDIAFIDLRLSQLESCDLRGIPTPDMKLNSSKWLPPETIPFELFNELEVPGDPKKRKFKDGGILFLDEFNRARFDVLQAAFQLVLDRKVGLHKLLDNWFIVCSGNLGEEDRTEITEMSDSALNNRFIHFFVQESGMFDCWMEWAQAKGKINSDVVNFLKLKPSYLYTKPNEDEIIFCTPRSWDKFSQLLNQNLKTDPSNITKTIGPSILGTTTIAFLTYLKEKKRIKPEDILDNYQAFENTLTALQRDKKYSISNEILTYIKDHNKITKKQIENLNRFLVEQLDPDHMIAMFKSLVNINVKYGNKTLEFLDVYLDMFPDMNEKIVEILSVAKGDANDKKGNA